MHDTDSSSAELVVQRQLDAYNARDIDAFMACWAEDAEYFAFPDQLLARGRAALRERHVARFGEANLYGRLLGRFAVGGLVVDREIVTRSFPDGLGEIDVIAIYEVADGLIAKAWFRMGVPRLEAPGMKLRTAVPEDAGAVRALTRDAYAKWVPAIGREPRPMSADYELAVRTHRIDLLHFDGTLAALIEMVPHEDHLWIENVAVAPAFQGRGLGRRLLAHAERVAEIHGVPTVRLLTNKMMAANIDLYRRVGYRIDREEPSPYGFAVYMSRPVAVNGLPTRQSGL